MKRPPVPSRAALIAAFATLYLTWGSTYLAIRYMVETFPPFLGAGIRYLIAGALVYAWASRRGMPSPGAAAWRAAAVTGTLLMVGGNGFLVWAEQFLPSGVAAMLIGTTPFWMVGLHWGLFAGPRPGRWLLLGLVLGVAGTTLLAAPGRLGGGFDARGTIAVLAATFSWSLGSLLARRMALPKSALLTTAMQMLAGSGSLLILSGMAGEWGSFSASAVSNASLLSLGYLIVIGTAGFLCFVWLNQVTTPAMVSTYASVNPVVAVLIGWVIGHETLSPRIMVAAATIVTGVVTVTLADPITRAPRRVSPRGSASAPRRG